LNANEKPVGALVPCQELVKYDVAEGIETRHQVTPYFCRKDAKGEFLSTGVIMALFDEISTCGAILQVFQKFECR
jgi:hypothetical protein